MKSLFALTLTLAGLAAAPAADAQQARSQASFLRQQTALKRYASYLQKRSGSPAMGPANPLGAASFDIYLASRHTGTPPRIEHQIYDPGTGRFINNFEADMDYTGARLPYRALIGDSGATNARARLRWDYRPVSGKLERYSTDQDLGQGLRNTGYLQYVFDDRDSNRGCDTYTADYTTGITQLVDGAHFKNTYDAQNRLVSVIDSSYDQLSRRYVVTDGISYEYAGTQRLPHVLTLHDTTGGQMSEVIRYASIIWDDFSRGWMRSADMFAAVPGMGWVRTGIIRGQTAANGLEHAMTTSFVFDPSTPPSPVSRMTTGYNAEGDYVLTKSEMYLGDTLGWLLGGGQEFRHAYDRPGRELSIMTAWDISGQPVPRERFLYIGGIPTANRPGADAPALTLAPNPATGSVCITAPAAANGTLISDAGRQVKALNLKAGPNTLSLAGLAPGLYQVMVQGQPSTRLVVQ